VGFFCGTAGLTGADAGLVITGFAPVATCAFGGDAVADGAGAGVCCCVNKNA